MTQAGFSDHFSGHADSYAAHRPGYPQALFDWLARQCPRRQCAWDCATGSGQAAGGIAPYFEHVVATDASSTQIDNAVPHVGVEYRVATAEDSGLRDSAIDLITVAQALHWFDLPAFFAEVQRVTHEGAVITAWSYERSKVNGDIDKTLEMIFDEVEAYWPPEREIVENRYRDIVLPGEPLTPPPFDMTVDWTADNMLAYLRTWSATRRYMADRNADPVGLHEQALKDAWGDNAQTVHWPLTMLVSRL